MDLRWTHLIYECMSSYKDFEKALTKRNLMKRRLRRGRKNACGRFNTFMDEKNFSEFLKLVNNFFLKLVIRNLIRHIL